MRSLKPDTKKALNALIASGFNGSTEAERDERVADALGKLKRDGEAGKPVLYERPVHEWFGLSYAAYLVLPRLVMDSMPVDWQRQVVTLLEQASERFGDHYDSADYAVTLLKDGTPVPDPLTDYRHGRLEPKG